MPKFAKSVANFLRDLNQGAFPTKEIQVESVIVTNTRVQVPDN